VIQSKGVERPLVLRFHASWCSVRKGGREGGREGGERLQIYKELTNTLPSLPPSPQACKKFAPSWQQTANAYGDHFDFVDVDVTVREGGREGGRGGMGSKNTFNGCQNDGLDEADAMGRTRRIKGREEG